jgi:hypothetical protein
MSTACCHGWSSAAGRLSARIPDMHWTRAASALLVILVSPGRRAISLRFPALDRLIAEGRVARPPRPGLPEPLQLAGDPHALSRALDELRGELALTEVPRAICRAATLDPEVPSLLTLGAR